MNKEKEIEKKIPCEVYSRVVGFFRPIGEWNRGQREQFKKRKYIDLKRVETKLYD